MESVLPRHVLSVTPEGIRELDGPEALSKLWTLFTRCKESIENGRRLENISWRLWYRDIISTSLVSTTSGLKSDLNNFLSDAQVLNEKSYRPPTPSEKLASTPSDQVVFGQQLSLCTGSVASHTVQPTDTFRKPLRSLPVGQIICGILPSSAHSPTTSSSFISLSMSPTRLPRMEGAVPPPVSLGRPNNLHTFLPILPLLPLPGESRPRELGPLPPSQLPTPGTERDESAPFGTKLHQGPSPSTQATLEPTLVQGSTGDRQSLPSIIPAIDDSGVVAHAPVATPPRLVVVNPTPGPTPCPTPPATPLAPMPEGRARTRADFLAPPSGRTSSQLTPVPPPVFDSPSVAVPEPINRSSPKNEPHQLPISTQRPEAQVTASQNPNRLSTSSTTSTTSTAATMTTTSNASSSQLSIGATSVHSDGSSGDLTKSASSSEAHKSATPMGPPSASRNAATSPPSPRQAAAPSTSVASVKSNRSAGAKSRSGAPGLVRRASGGGAASGRSRRAAVGQASTVNRTASSDASRSRSRDATASRASAAGALAATMGMTAGGPGKKRLGGARAGGKRTALARTSSRANVGAALTRTLSHEEVEEVTDEGASDEEQAERDNVAARLEAERAAAFAAKEAAALRERERAAGASKAKFKFGSNSDNGSAAGTEVSSRHPGSLRQGMPSAFEVLALQAAAVGKEDVKGKGREPAGPVQPSVDARRAREPPVQQPKAAPGAEEGERQARREQRRREEVEVAALPRAGEALAPPVLPDTFALPRAHESLAEPLLPQGGKRTILLTSESEYTDTDGEDGEDSWTSEDGEGAAVAVETTTSRQQPSSSRQSQSESRHLQEAQQLAMQRQQADPAPPPQRPAPGGLQRTQSNVSGRHTRREWQHIQQRREAQLRIQRAAAVLQREEAEKLRQKEMFAKKPTSSFQNLTEANRTQSFGYLTQLMNPDPSIFPVNHPYRRGHSSGNIQSMGGFGMGMTSMTAMTPAAGGQAEGRARDGKVQAGDQRVAQQQPEQRPNGDPGVEQAAARLPSQQPQQQQPREQHAQQRTQQQQQQQPRPQQEPQPTPSRAPRRCATQDDMKVMPPPPPPLERATTTTENKAVTQPPSPVRSEKRQSISNSAMAMALRGIRSLGLTGPKKAGAAPLATQVAVGSVQSKGAVAPPSIAPDLKKGASAGSSGGYRPKGPLPGQEMDTDSEDEADNSVQLSQSLAQDRLKQFAARRGIVPAGAQMSALDEGGEIPVLAREQERPAPPQPQPQGQVVGGVGRAFAAVPATPVPKPIPMHPYNLPVNAVPSTPRTTRRQMLKNEMSESLRRQLLWERKQGGMTIRRTSSTGGYVGGGAPSRHNVLNPLQPMTTNTSMVQLSARGQQQQQQQQAGPSHLRQEVGGEPAIAGTGDRERRASSGRANEAAPDEREQMRQQAMARNRSWADNYHGVGW